MDIADRLELFVDRHLIDRLEGARLVLHRPEPREVVLTFSEPWEAPSAAYVTVIRGGEACRMYYRGTSGDPATDPPTDMDVVCYAESRDGVTWTKPSLGLHAFRGTTANNIIMVPGKTAGLTHNFAPCPSASFRRRACTTNAPSPRGAFIARSSTASPAPC